MECLEIPLLKKFKQSVEKIQTKEDGSRVKPGKEKGNDDVSFYVRGLNTTGVGVSRKSSAAGPQEGEGEGASSQQVHEKQA